MYEELLSEIGLTKSEIAVYFALLNLGSSTTGPIIKKAGIASGKAYLILDKLITKGLATSSIRANVKHYQATNPERILDYLKDKETTLKDKEKQLESVIPELKAKFEEKKYKPLAEVFEGEKGLKSFYEQALKEMKKGECFYVLGATRKTLEKLNAYFLDWHKRRIEKGIKLKIIYNPETREWGKVRAKMKLTEVRYLPKELETPAWIDIYNDCVANATVVGEMAIFLIRNKESAESYRNYFDFIWKNSVK